MKKRNIILGLLAIMAVVAVGLLFNIAVGLFTGVALAATTGATSNTVDSETIDDESSELNRPTISQVVTEMKPSRTPLDSIMRMAAKKTVKAPGWKYEYYAVDNRPFTDTVKTAYTAASSTTAEIAVDDIDIWNVDDTILVRGSTGSDGLEVQLYVYDIDTVNGKLRVQASNVANRYVPSIAEDTVLLRMATAKNESDAQTSPFAMIPQKSYNYLQYFMAQIEQSTYSEKHNKEVQYGFNDFARQQIYDLRATMELTQLFGYRDKFSDKLDKVEKYFTGGVTRFIENELEYAEAGKITHDDLVDWSKSIFASNAGSDSRVMFGGSGFTASMMKIKKVEESGASETYLDYTVKQLSNEKTNVKLGLKFRTIETNFGTIYYYYHPLFDEAGWEDKAIVLDINNLEKAVFQKMQKRDIDLLGSGQKNAKAKVIEEISALIVRYPDTHAIIAPAA